MWLCSDDHDEVAYEAARSGSAKCPVCVMRAERDEALAERDEARAERDAAEEKLAEARDDSR